ncbi:MAG: crossover junction endodeoxyribonuclease RuvC [Thermodesulfobacteriota bacterium]
MMTPVAAAPIVLGLDPGSQRTGYAVVAAATGGKVRLIAAGALSAPAGRDLPARLAAIYDQLRQIIAEHAPAEMAVEGVFTHKNARTALVLGQARGVALLAGAQAGLAIYEYPPATVKKSLVGTGQASKEQVRAMAQRLAGGGRLSLDASDALALALTHLHSRRLGAALERLK